ncbi:hypothetical protein ACFX13_015093 [Malus domestica]
MQAEGQEPTRALVLGSKTPQRRWVSESNWGDASVASSDCPRGFKAWRSMWVQLGIVVVDGDLWFRRRGIREPSGFKEPGGVHRAF